MGINIADNFAYNGKKPMDNRTEYATLSAMKAVVDANINEGCLAYNKEDGKYYKFLSTNTVDVTTGKWREFSGGGSYVLPIASANDLGGIKVGSNLSIDANGVLSAQLPNVDLSNSSVESDILDTTEKAVGTTTDGYLIYQKVVSTGGAVPSGATLLMRVALLNSTDIIRYTKTTDSPLPSGVKFAGVTSTGEVIYQKTYTGQTANQQTRAWTTIESNFASTKNLYGISDGHATEISTGLKFTVPTYLGSSSIVAGIGIVNGDLKIVTEGAEPISYNVTIHYTLSS